MNERCKIRVVLNCCSTGNICTKNDSFGRHETFTAASKHDGLHNARPQWLALLYFDSKHNSGKPIFFFQNQIILTYIFFVFKLMAI